MLRILLLQFLAIGFIYGKANQVYDIDHGKPYFGFKPQRPHAEDARDEVDVYNDNLNQRLANTVLETQPDQHDKRRQIKIQRRNIHPLYREKKLDVYLTKGIYQLIISLEKLNRNIETQISLQKNKTKNGTTTTVAPKSVRRKREVKDYDTTGTDKTEGTDKTTVQTTTDPTETTAESILETTETSKVNKTDTVTTVAISNDKLDFSGRRSFLSRTPDDRSSVKYKLLSYLDDTYKEIVNKIKPIQVTKQSFANDDIYKIGYIIANIDTLEVNVKNLKQDIDVNKDSWDDQKILDLFDKLLVSNKIVTNLLDSLNGYVNKTALKKQSLSQQRSMYNVVGIQ